MDYSRFFPDAKQDDLCLTLGGKPGKLPLKRACIKTETGFEELDGSMAELGNGILLAVQSKRCGDTDLILRPLDQRGGIDCQSGAHVDNYFCPIFCGDDCMGVVESYSDYFLGKPQLEFLDIESYGPSLWYARNKGSAPFSLVWPDGRTAEAPADGRVYRLETRLHRERGGKLMTYNSYTKQELSQLGIQENELAIYTGTTNPRNFGTLSPGVNSKNVYAYIWKDGQPRELDVCFRHDSADLDVLEVQTGEEEYAFLRDKASGYIRQISGPPKPIAIVNIGALPLRVDTVLGKFTVHAGTMLRLNESIPQREKKKVLLTVNPRSGQFLTSAELWDGASWRRLNIRADSDVFGADRNLAVLDGNAIVQYLEVSRSRPILVMDSPEPDPDYELYITGEIGDRAALRFQRTDYQSGRVVQRVRILHFSRRGEPIVYDLQKLRESPAQIGVEQCTAELPGVPDIFELPELAAETPFPDDRTENFAPKGRHPLNSDKLREFLEGEVKLSGQPSASEKALIPESPENFLE